jgi:hypothetical protein
MRCCKVSRVVSGAWNDGFQVASRYNQDMGAQRIHHKLISPWYSWLTERAQILQRLMVGKEHNLAHYTESNG